ncbi:MAG: DUF4380 domain-containing protein [Planctomycetota bacterium]
MFQRVFAFGFAVVSAVQAFGASPMPGNASASSESTKPQLRNGPITIVVDPEVGGRIASMTHEGSEILKTTRDENNWHWGSTVWVAPQSDWRWPPSTALDSEPYTVIASDDSRIIMRSRRDPDTGFQLTKRIRIKPNAKSPTFEMTYTLDNGSDETKRVALWENTRVNWKGSTRFAKGTEIRTSNSEKSAVVTETAESLTIRFDEKQPDGQKLFCTPPVKGDSKWIWNSYRLGDLILTKSRIAPAQVAPKQAPLEIYFGKDAGFAELEFQGPYEELEPGESASFTVIWRLKSVKK